MKDGLLVLLPRTQELLQLSIFGPGSGSMLWVDSFRGSQLGVIWPPGDIWYLDTRLVVTSGEGELLAPSREKPDVFLKSLQGTGQPPQQGITCPQMSTRVRLRTPGLSPLPSL